MNTLTLLTTLLGVVPQIIQLVTGIEQATAGAAGAGADKLAAVLNVVFAGLQTTIPAVLQKLGADKVASFITNVVSEVVGLLNKLNIFTHASTPSSGSGAPAQTPAQPA